MNAARARLAAVDRHVISTRWGAVEYAEQRLRRPGARGAWDLSPLRRRTPFRPRPLSRPSSHRSVSIRLSRLEHAAERDASRPGRRVRGSARRARDRPDRRHRPLSRCDIGAATGPASSREGEASRCAGGQPAGKSHCRRPTVLGKVINRQFVMWALRTFAPSTMVRMVAAVPKGFAMTSEDARFVNEFIDSLFPVSPRASSSTRSYPTRMSTTTTSRPSACPP